MDILTLAGEFKSNVELQAYCDAQFTTLQKAQERIKQLETEVAHLKEVLAGAAPLVGEPKIEVMPGSTEQTICEIQINMMQDIAKVRSLTLEETKRLDLLIKNLYLAKAQSNALTPDFYRLPSNVSEAKLMQIASSEETQIEAD